jgi:hypothetical protein
LSRTYTQWLSRTTDLSALYAGQVGHTYSFYSIATDNVGHAETAPVTADTTTTIVPAPLPDYNGNAAVDAADYVMWRKTLGANGLMPYSGADGNGNRTVDQLDYNEWRSHFGSSVPAAAASQVRAATSTGIVQTVSFESAVASQLKDLQADKQVDRTRTMSNANRRPAVAKGVGYFTSEAESSGELLRTSTGSNSFWRNAPNLPGTTIRDLGLLNSLQNGAAGARRHFDPEFSTITDSSDATDASDYSVIDRVFDELVASISVL